MIGSSPDRTLQLPLYGYEFITVLRREHDSDIFDSQLLGHRVTCLTGPGVAETFYDSDRFERRTALPGPVRKTLMGEGGVQGLDGDVHHHRKALFMSMMTPDSINQLLEATGAEWARAVTNWGRSEKVVLFDEVSELLTRAVCRWADVPVPVVGTDILAHNLVAMVDGFATLGPRHWKARQARTHTERWAGRVIDDIRNGTLPVREGSVARMVAEHREWDGEPLSRDIAAVELLNIIRPTVALTWYVTFAAHALHQHPQWRARISGDGDETLETFAQEVRRLYPFAPFVAARVGRDFEWREHRFPQGRLVLLDVYGINHDARLWPDPDNFDPDRFVGRDIGAYDLIPQGAGHPDSGHRCAGERITVEVIRQAARVLSGISYELPPQDLTIGLHRIPTMPRSGFRMQQVRATQWSAVPMATT
ncbi:MAG: cytochrome P450 [Micromonosporaceae bacterium]